MKSDSLGWLRILLWLAFLVVALLHLNGCAASRQSSVRSSQVRYVFTPRPECFPEGQLEFTDSTLKKLKPFKVKSDCVQVEVIQK